MYREKNFDCERTSFVFLMIVSVLSGAMTVSAQGWRASGPTSNTVSQPSAASKSTAPKPAASAPKTAKRSAKTPAAGGANASNAGHERGTTPDARGSSGVAANKGSRERIVTGAKQGSTSHKAVSNDSAPSPAKTGRCDPENDERTDLSGTYSGNVNYPAAGLEGDATLRISGNRFTLNSGSKTETGNITAVTTCNYTAVALMFGQWKTPQPGEPVQPPLPMLSLRATRTGDKLTLIPAPSERRVFLFEPAGKK